MEDATNSTLGLERELAARDRERRQVGIGRAVGQEMSAPACDTPGPESFHLGNIDDAMRYQPWDREQCAAGDIVREALTAAAKAILRNVPAGPYRTVAIRKLLEARMDANAAITFRGRF